MMTDKPSAVWRKLRLPLGALLLSGVLLFTGLSALKGAGGGAVRAERKRAKRTASAAQL